MKNILIVLLILFGSSKVFSQSIESEINKFAGNFSGEWTAFKLDKNYEVIKAISWKDTLRTDKPIINDSLAFVNIKSIMVFDNPQIPNYNMSFKEGFKIKNSKIDTHFFTTMGIETIETKIGDNTYVISQEISPFELKQLGVNSAISATNTTVKVITLENQIEVHRISRISTITIEHNSEQKTVQFVSLKGFHKRIE